SRHRRKLCGDSKSHLRSLVMAGRGSGAGSKQKTRTTNFDPAQQGLGGGHPNERRTHDRAPHRLATAIDRSETRAIIGAKAIRKRGSCQVMTVEWHAPPPLERMKDSDRGAIQSDLQAPTSPMKWT